MDQSWWRTPEQLDADQQEIVSLPLEGSHLVTGPPGSGKTNLLLLRATYLTRAGFPNIAIITFNRLLKEFLVTGATNYPFEPDRLQTFRSWGSRTLKSNGIPVDTNRDFDTMMSNIKSGLADLCSSDISDVKLDCILIDESQDYTVDEIKLMASLSEEVFAVGDNNQRIYKANGSLGYLETICNVADPLTFHYRNGMSICRLADGIMNTQHDGLAATCNYDEAAYPSSVQRFSGLSIAKQVERAIPDLETQMFAYPDQWIGVLAPLKKDVVAVYAALAKSKLSDLVQLQKYDEGYDALDRQRPIVVSTMHSAKGLEYRATHLFALDHIGALDHHQRLAYTAVTRAKTSLSLYHDGSLEGYLERGLVAVQGGPTGKPSLSSLFGDSGT